MKMIVFSFLLSFLSTTCAFNENLTAVHYSIVTPGIEKEIAPGKTLQYCNPNIIVQLNLLLKGTQLTWNCIDCKVVNDGDSIIVENRFGEPSDMQLSTEIEIEIGHNLRLAVEVIDYVANLIQDNSIARTTVEAYLDYGNNIQSAKANLVCCNDCLKGVFIGDLNIRNPYEKSGIFELVIKIHAMNNDSFKLKRISLGDLVLASEVFPASKGEDYMM